MREWNRLRLVTPPADAIISIEKAKQHLRVYHTDDDAFIDDAILAARAVIEGPNGAGICLTPQQWRLSLDIFPGSIIQAGRASHAVGYQMGNAYSEISIPLGPVTAINSIAYTDSNGAPQTVSTFRVDYDTEPCRIWPARDQAWPIVVFEPGAVKVTFTAGFASTPADLVWAVRLLLSHFYEHREAVVGVLERSITPTELPLGVEAILSRYRVGMVA